MSLDTFNVVIPNKRNQASGGTGTDWELVLEQFSGDVEGTIERRSLMQGWVPVRPVRGTDTISNYAVGEVELGVVQRGVTPDGTDADFSKATLVVDTLVYARNILSLIDVFTTAYDARKELAVEHGKKIAKFYDEAFFIQAIKASLQTTSRYGSAGHLGGTQVTIAAGDVLDPAALYASIAELFAQMELKDVIPSEDDLVIAMAPAQFYALLQAEQIINGEYVTAAGTKVEGGYIFKAFGCPVVRSNNFPGGKVITNHFLSNARNSNAYDGDFTDVLMVAFSARALMAGETIPLESDVYYDKISKSWYVDSHLSFGVTTNRAEYAGAVVIG